MHGQHGNQHHSALKAMVNEKFRGVSSYRLPSYLRWYERTQGKDPWQVDDYFDRLASATTMLYPTKTTLR